MTALLEIRDLKAEIAGKQILNGYNLTVKPGEVHAIMGPNGSGKSNVLLCVVGAVRLYDHEGQALFAGADLSARMSVDDRAAAGLFLAFQYPLEVPGVATITFSCAPRSTRNAERSAARRKCASLI